MRATGAELVTSRAFPDHHPYTAIEAANLLSEATQLKALPVTTAKDQVRLPRAVQGHVTVFTIRLVFSQSTELDELLARL